jgi:hypothetical protein
MTHEEIRALDAFCRERFIELVPHQQSFGHLQRWLELPRYRGLAIRSWKIKEAATRRALASDSGDIITEHRRLWLTRNREGGLGESAKILEARQTKVG